MARALLNQPVCIAGSEGENAIRRGVTGTVAAFGMVVLALSLGASPALALSFTGNHFVLSNGYPDTLGGIDDVIIPKLDVRSDAFVGNTLGGPGFASDFHPNNVGTSGYRAVHWTGAFQVGQGGATISLSADDDARLFLNGALLDSAPDPSPEASPEPAALLLFGTTLAGLGVILRRRLNA